MAVKARSVESELGVFLSMAEISRHRLSAKLGILLSSIKNEVLLGLLVKSIMTRSHVSPA